MRESASSPRMFKSDLVDFFSRAPWWIVPLLWLPFSAGLFAYSRENHPELALSWFIAIIGIGWCTWTFSEYWLHRLVFHWEPNFNWGKKFHFIIHGVHHDWPNDHYRLVMPPAASMIICVLFGAFFFIVLGRAIFFPFFGGYVIGYVQYELTHYAVHHLKSKNRHFKDMKRHHLLHHHSAQYKGKKFGVSNTVWDRIFGTYR